MSNKITDLYRDKPSNPRKKLMFDLPLPPSVNHMYYNLRNGRRVLTKTAKKYIADSKALVNLAIEEQDWRKQKKSVWFYVDLLFYMPDRKIRDSHNMIKLLLDGLQGNAVNNDYYVMPRVQGVEYDKENPRVSIRVSMQSEAQRKRALNMFK